MNSATAAGVRMLIAEYFRVPPNRIVNQTKFRDLGADWVDLIELFLMIEDQLPARQTDKLIVGQIETVADLLLALIDLPVRSAGADLCSAEEVPLRELIESRSAASAERARRQMAQWRDNQVAKASNPAFRPNSGSKSPSRS